MFTLNYDSAGRMSSLSSSVADSSHPGMLFNVKTFNPFGWDDAYFGVVDGSNSALTSIRGFDVRGRLTGLTVKAGKQ